MDQLPVVRGHKELLEKVRQEWDQAEADIKLAEQVCRSVIIPSVNELRYAGRRVVELLLLIYDEPAYPQAQSLAQDACFDCHRARHDAVDAAISKIALDLEVMLDILGHEVVLTSFAQFPALVQKLQDMQQKVVLSRQDRTNREKIYAVLEGTQFPEIVGMYKELQASESAMTKIATARRRERLRNNIFGYVGLVSLVIGAVGLYLAWLSAPPQSAAPATVIPQQSNAVPNR